MKEKMILAVRSPFAPNLHGTQMMMIPRKQT